MVASLLAIALVIIQGTLGGPYGKFAPAFYLIFCLAVLLKTRAAGRIYAAILLGLLADLFSSGRFGGFALALVAGCIISDSLNKKISPDSFFGRAFLAFVFVLTVQVLFLLVADPSMTVESLPERLRLALGTSLGNALIAAAIWPFFAILLTKTGKPVTYVSNL